MRPRCIAKHGRPLAILVPFAEPERLRPIELADADLEPFVAAAPRRESLRRDSGSATVARLMGTGSMGPTSATGAGTRAAASGWLAGR